MATTTKLEEVLDDLCARFLANLPHEEASSHSRLGFQLEQAFWFYEDFYRRPPDQPSSHQPNLPKLNFRHFTELLLGRCPKGHPARAMFRTSEELDRLIEHFYRYKSQVPTCGAIILNPLMSHCLMVRGFGSRSSWGFPKGKIAKGELPPDCAVREVREETGFDIRPYLNVDDFIQVELGKRQFVRLYIVAGVSESTIFAPLTRREIGDIAWHPIRGIGNLDGPNRYYNVGPFLPKLRNWIRARKPKPPSALPSSSSSHTIKHILPTEKKHLKPTPGPSTIELGEKRTKQIQRYHDEIMLDLTRRLEVALAPLRDFKLLFSA